MAPPLPEDIQQFLIKNIDVEVSLTDVGGTRSLRGLQHFFAKKFADRELHLAYQAILGHASAAEACCSGSGMEFLRLLCGRPTKAAATKRSIDMKKLLHEAGLSSNNVSLVMQAYLLAGKHSKMAIKKSTGPVPTVELLNGYNFDIRSVQQVNLKGPKILCIDGYIESVAEIHHMLEILASTREAAVLFVRGLADDVLHTLKVNLNRGTLKVHPLIVPFDLDHANTMADIATISGGDVVSHLRGDLISSIDHTALRQVDSIALTHASLIINNSKTSSRVAEHRKRLIEDLQNRPEISDILEKRIKSRTPSYVEISLVDGIDYLSNSSQVDEAIRRIADMLVGKDPAAIATEFFNSYIANSQNTTVV